MMEFKNLDAFLPDDRYIEFSGIRWKIPGDLPVETVLRFWKAQDAAAKAVNIEDLTEEKLMEIHTPIYEALCLILKRLTPITLAEKLQAMFGKKEFPTTVDQMKTLVRSRRLALVLDEVAEALRDDDEKNSKRPPGKVPP